MAAFATAFPSNLGMKEVFASSEALEPPMQTASLHVLKVTVTARAAATLAQALKAPVCRIAMQTYDAVGALVDALEVLHMKMSSFLYFTP